MRVIEGSGAVRRRTQLQDAYDHFRLERQGNRVSRDTLIAYDFHVGSLLKWLDVEHPEVRRIEDLTVAVLRAYRAEQATRTGYHGRPLAAETLQGSHGHIRAFLRWAENEGYPVDAKALKLPRIRVPAKEPTVFHVAQLKQILAGCNAAFPTQELAVRILVGSGIRASDLRAGDRWTGRSARSDARLHGPRPRRAADQG